jgi:hypothetical protein
MFHTEFVWVLPLPPNKILLPSSDIALAVVVKLETEYQFCDFVLYYLIEL